MKINLLLPGLLLMCLLAACEDPSPCASTNCGPNGVCVEDGTTFGCLCTRGWTGTFCDTSMADRWLGNYTVTSVCDTGSSTYSCAIQPSSVDPMQIVFTNLDDRGIAVIAWIESNPNSFGIPIQSFGSDQIAAEGFLTNNSRIDLNLVIFTTAGSKNCELTLVRQ